MKTFALGVWLLVVASVLVGCGADALRKVPNDNKSITLELLLTTPEGCKVYRFEDEYNRYVAVCPRDMQTSASFDDVQSTGKVTTRVPQSISTVFAP